MAKRGQKLAQGNRARAQRDADALCRRIGLPTSQSPESVIGSIMGALDPDILAEYDTYAGQDAARLAFMFDDPERALWLATGLRLPMVRFQLGWLIWVLRAESVGGTSVLLDIGSGSGFTAAALSRALRSSVYAIDPQAGSASAANWAAERLGTKIDASEATLEGWSQPSGREPDVVIAQAVLWYLQPDLERAEDSLASLTADPPRPSNQMAAFLDHCARVDCVLVMDHDFPDLWFLVINGLAQRGLFPDWSHAEDVTCRLPGRDDRQLSLVFTRERATEDDIARLGEFLGPGD